MGYNGYVGSFAFAMIALTSPAFAAEAFLPPNNLHLQDNIAFTADITEQEFNDIVNKIVDRYKPLAQLHGATLKSNNLWKDPTVNASAQQSGNSWIINMYGGLARRPEVTKDGFALVVCHELGHHFGGFPLYEDGDWAASEGQSDYFATQACARLVWEGDITENAKSRALIPAYAKERCDAQWRSENEQNLCYRAALGGQSLAVLLAALGREGTPKFETPDQREVSRTSTAHPAGQCRLDTYFSGALCGVAFDPKVIPGKDNPAGQDGIEAETEASKTSCMLALGHTLGTRPHCWFKPNLQFMGMKLANATHAESQGNGNGVVEPGETVSFNFALTNARAETTTGISAQLVSASGVTVLQGNTTFPDIASGETQSNSEPLSVRINNDATCGSNVDVTLKAKSDMGAVSVKKSFMIGKLVSELAGEYTNATRIPDGSYSGVTTQIENTSVSTSEKVAVSLDITHPNMSEVRAVLTSPNGLQRTLFYAGDKKGANLKETILIDWKQTNAKGVWKLKIVDWDSSNEGTLNNWSMSLATPRCE